MKNLKKIILAGILIGMSSLGQAADMWWKCRPISIGVFPQRMHVKCLAQTGGDVVIAGADTPFPYLAIPFNNAVYAEQAMSLIQNAMANNKVLNVLLDGNDVSGGAIGCATSDCRLLKGLTLDK